MMSRTPQNPARKVEYVIFDMDGLLIDTEKLLTEITNEILGRYGRSMTWEIKAGLMCKPTRTAAAHLLSFFPEIPLTVDDFLGQREAKYVSRWETVQPLPGAVKLVTHLHAHGIPIALATSEQRMRYEDKTKHLQHLFSCFGDRVVCGDDYPGVMWGRPRPDIFLLAARDKLGMKVGEPDDNCSDEEQAARAKGLVFEDAIAGFQGAKRAGMSVIWVPDRNILKVGHSGIQKPDLVIRSLEDFVPEQWGLPAYSHARFYRLETIAQAETQTR